MSRKTIDRILDACSDAGYCLINRWPNLVNPWLDGIVSGICFERIREHYAANVFAQPLYVPSTFLSLSNGHRLRVGGVEQRLNLRDWAERLPNILSSENSARQKLAVLTPSDMLIWLRQHECLQSFAWQECLAFSYARVSDYPKAIIELDRLIKHPQLRSDIDWCREVTDNALALMRAINQGQAAAQSLLSAWEESTALNLRLALRI